MNKQTKTYVLLAAVIVIWGIIAFKIFGGRSTTNVDDQEVVVDTFRPIVLKKRDTFSILANYRDPFLGTFPKKKEKVKGSTKRPAKEPEIEVEYTGYITDTGTKSKIYFVTINGQQLLMNPKDKINGVKLLNGTATQIRVQSNGKSRIIKLKQQ